MKISIENAEHYEWGGNCHGWHLTKHDSLSVIQEHVPPGAQEVRHLHKNARQFFYILRGTATIEMDGKEYCVKAGEGVEIAPGTAHQFSNRSDQDVVFLVVSSPNSQGDRM